jgi:hypothetical protein
LWGNKNNNHHLAQGNLMGEIKLGNLGVKVITNQRHCIHRWGIFFQDSFLQQVLNDAGARQKATVMVAEVAGLKHP